MASVVKVLPALELAKVEVQRLRRISRPHEDHVRRDGTAAGRVTAGGDDRLPEDLASLNDGTQMAGSRHTAEPVLALGPDIEDVDQVRGVPPGREALDGGTAWISRIHRIHKLDDDPVRVEGGEPGEPLALGRCLGEGAQHVPTVQVPVSVVAPVWTGPRPLLSLRLDAPGRTSLEWESGGAGLALEMEGVQPYVPYGKEERGRLLRPLEADRSRGLRHQLGTPPGSYREGARERFHPAGPRWDGGGASQLGVRPAGQRSSWPGRAPDGAARADIPDDATGLAPLRRTPSPRPSP